MANAGSGKTYVLARRVVQLLLEGARPESIVCLTYTKAAASEMHHRIVMLLKELAVREGEALQQTLANIIGAEPNVAQVSIAPALLNVVLDSPLGGLQITTIHGFCQRLLASFPLEAGISPHTTLMDDREQAEIIHQSIRKLYVSEDSLIAESLGFVAEIVSEGRLSQWLTRLIYQRGDWRDLISLSTHQAMRESIESRHPLDSYDRNVWQQRLMDTPNDMLKAAAQILSRGTATQQQLAAVFAQWLSDKSNVDEYVLAWLTKEEKQPRKNIAKIFGKTTGPAQEMLREQQRVYEIMQALGIIACIEETYHMAVLARALNQLYAEAKQHRSALDYDDLIAYVEQLFARDLPWVMTKLDYRIDHLLLDEAQDTSPAQWRLTETLVKDLFSVETASGQARSLFVVGDEKQSIYSFQGAAPEMFARMRDEWSQVLPITSFTRLKSYRSVKPILQLADVICGANHMLHREGEGGRIELWPLIEQSEKIETEPYSVAQEALEEERAEATLALQIAGTIQSWLNEKRPLASQGRAITAGDIMILVHRRKPMTPLLIRELQRLDIPVAGIDRLALSSHLAVKDMVALMRWVITPEDDLALAQILRSPLIGLSEEELLEVAYGRGQASLWQRLKHYESLQHWRERCEYTPYQFLHQLLEIEQKRDAYAARLGPEIHEVLDALLEHAAACENEPVTLLSYAIQLEHSAREIKREATNAYKRNEVRVMTVHGAKGLEAPVVILVDTTSVPDLRKEMWFEGPTVAITDTAKMAPVIEPLQAQRRDELLREYKRLLYVAITRAEDELYIAGIKPARKKIDNSWYNYCAEAIATLGGIKDESGVYTLIEPQIKPVNQQAEPLIVPVVAPDWAKQKAVKEVNEVYFSPSRMATHELALYEASAGDARTRGIIIHQLLELSSGKKDVSTLEKTLKHIAPEWTEQMHKDTAKQVYDLLIHPTYGWIWDLPGYNEVSIAGSIMINGSSRRMSGQIDRLIVTEKEVLILDYKTSANIPKTPADTGMNYVLQMKAYRDLLTAKYKDKTVRCALLWTHAPRLDFLDEIVAHVAWDSFREAS